MKPRTHAMLALMLGLLGSLVTSRAAALEADKPKSRVQVGATATVPSVTGESSDCTASVLGDATALYPAAVKQSVAFADLRIPSANCDKEWIRWECVGTPEGSSMLLGARIGKAGSKNVLAGLRVCGVFKSIASPCSVKKEGERVASRGKVSMVDQNVGMPLSERWRWIPRWSSFSPSWAGCDLAAMVLRQSYDI